MEKNIVEEIIEKIKKNEDVIYAAGETVKELEKAYENALNEHEIIEKDTVMFDAVDILDDFADIIEEETDIDLDDIVTSVEYDKFIDNIELDGDTENVQIFAAYILTQIVDCDLLENVSYYCDGGIEISPRNKDIKSFDDIVKKAKKSDVIKEEVENVVKNLNEKYNKLIEEKDFDIEAYDKTWISEEKPYLFSIDDEFDKLAELIEDVCDFDIEKFTHSETEQYHKNNLIPDGSVIEVVWYIACRLSKDELLRSGHPYEGNVRFTPNDSDMEHMREYKDAIKDLGALLTDGQDMTITLNDCPCGYGALTSFTLDEAITAFCNSNFGIANNFDENDFNEYWIWVKSDNTLIKRDLFTKLLKFGTPFNVDGNLGIKSNDIEEVKELLKDSWYSVIDVKDALITDIPFDEKEIATTLRNINK